MTDRARPPASRIALDARWELARDGADDWREIGAPRPVAAVLSERGEWSIDGPARRFDAEAWAYRLRLDAPAGALASGALLGFDGLATICDVTFNGAPVLASRNMFRAHVVQIPAASWRAAGNELVLRFGALDTELARRRPRPRWRAPMVEHQQLRFVRTTLLGRTPGWSPAAAVVGPWRGVWLQVLGGADGDDDVAAAAPEIVEQRAWIDGDDGRLDIAAWLPGGPALVSAVLKLVGEDGDADATREIAWKLERGADGLWRGAGTVPAVRRWWPHTHGAPAQYALSLRVLPLRASSGVDIGATATHALGRVGFRTIEIDRGADGTGFGLRVNGVDVFCRGVCWTPLDTLRLDAAPSDVDRAIATLRDAGANLVRVGGTMAYEDAAFFDACDAAGVMVWQEFMFANMDYPAGDAAFDEDVAAEAAQQLALWRRHASVAVVCGNSEVAQQAAMWGADRDAWTPALFHETLPALVARALPDVPYWPSSASGGAFPFQPAAGTTSYYGVGAYLRSVDDARTSGVRFATECLAFAQVPDDAGLARLAALQRDVPVRTHQPLWKERVPRDLGAGWDFDDVRDHYLAERFRLSADDARRGDLPTYWSLARAAACEAMAGAYAQWRSPASACRGALAWFARDLRAGAGWGVVDELGHPKAAFHALSRAWQPRHVGLVDEGQNGVFVHVVNESPDALAATLSLAFLQRGEVAVGRVERRVDVPPHGAWRESVLAHAHGFLDLNGSYRFGPAAADVIVATLRDDAGATIARTLLFLAPTLVRADIGLAATARRFDGGMRVTLRTRAAARAVHFEAPGWRASDEYFDLAPDVDHVVDFAPVAGHPTWYARVGAINASVWAGVVVAEEVS